MVKITVNITNPELEALEDFIVAWNLCKKHNQNINATQEDYFRFTQTCRRCVRINREYRRKALDVWRKLVVAYDKITERKQ